MNNILLIHQYAGNKGDRAVLYGLCRVLLTHKKDIRIIVSTSNPSLWTGYSFYTENHIQFIRNSWNFPQKGWWWKILQRFKKYTFTIQRELFLHNLHRFLGYIFINPEFVKACKKSDIIISVGGHHFTTILSRDLVSSINYDAISTFIINKPLYCISQSFGPFTFYNKRNKLLTTRILKKAKVLGIRDKESKNELERIGICNNLISLPETVISLNSIIPTYITPSKRKAIIGISVYVTQHRSRIQLESYIDSFSKICNQKISEGYIVKLFPMELKGTPPDDRWCLEEIINRVDDKDCISIIDHDLETYQHLEQVSTCRVFIGHKTHSVIFSLTTGTPTIALAYHPKTIDFMNQFQLREFAFKEEDFNAEDILDAFSKLEKDIDKIGNHIYKTAKLLCTKFEKNINGILKQ